MHHDDEHQHDSPAARVPLSAAGRARRDAMRSELIEAMHAHHRRRGVRRAALTVVVSTIAVAAATAVALRGIGPSDPLDLTRNRPPTVADAAETFDSTGHMATESAPAQARRATSTEPHADAPCPVRITRVQRAQPQQVDSMSDAELLGTLAEMGRPAGLIRFENETTLSQQVADDAPGRGDAVPPPLRGRDVSAPTPGEANSHSRAAI